MRLPFAKLRRNEDGVTMVEFALIAPTLLFMIMGLFELGHSMYVHSVLKGAMQDAGRDATLEGAKQIDMYNLVSDKVKNVAPDSDVTLTWYNFGSYTEIGALEDYTDTNGDGKCSKDEPFEDLNENGVHDYYDGNSGIGNARDAVVFRASVEYERLFPMPGLGGWSKTNTVDGITVLRNQPYRQSESNPSLGKCTGMETYDDGCSSVVAGIGLNCGVEASSSGNSGLAETGADAVAAAAAPVGRCHDHNGQRESHCH